MSKQPQSIFAYFSEIGATPSLSLNSWFLIRSINVCPHIHLNIRISVTSILFQKSSFWAKILSHTAKQVCLPPGKIFLLTYLGTSYHIAPRWLLATWANPHVYDDSPSISPSLWPQILIRGCTFNNLFTNGHLWLTYLWCPTKITTQILNLRTANAKLFTF